MKKLLFISCLVCIGNFVFLHGQVRPGIKLGLNNSNLSNTRLENKSDFYLGGLIDISLSDYYALQPEIIYSRQGGKSNSTEFGDVHIDYIAIIAANKFFVGPKKGFHFNVGLGFDFNVGGNWTPLFGSGDDEFDISPIDMTFSGGIGYEFGFGLTLEARYKQGVLSTDFLGSRDLFEENGSQLNSVYQVGLAYIFKTK